MNNPFLCYILLGLSIFSLWIFPKQKAIFPIILFILAIAVSFLTQRTNILGILWISTFISLFFILSKKIHKTLRIVTHIALIAIAIGFFLHVLPGFKNLKVWDAVKLSSDSLPLNMYLNFDKPLFGFLYVWLFITRAQSIKDWKKIFQATAVSFIPCCLILMGTAYAVHYVRLDLKFPSETHLWIFSNLLLVCVMEEAFFRGYIQQGLNNFIKKKYQSWLPLTLTAIIFGCFHFKAGLSFVLLASIAGFFYGYAYQKSQRIEAAVLTHFLVNATHYFLFSYPGLAI